MANWPWGGKGGRGQIKRNIGEKSTGERRRGRVGKLISYASVYSM